MENHRAALRGQAASEQMILFGVMLVVVLIAVSVSTIWPSFTYSVESQRSIKHWAAAKPFAVNYFAMFPNQMVLELKNNDPVSYTVKNIWLENYSLNFSNHSIPFNWSAASPRCSAGSCTMLVRPGQTQIISTVDYTTGNPCSYNGEFLEGSEYGIDLTITYHGSNNSSLENETGIVKLIGTCTPR